MMKKVLLFTLLCFSVVAFAQDLTVRSSTFSIDLKNNSGVTADIPTIEWVKPIPDINFSQNGRFSLTAIVKAGDPLASVTINIKDLKSGESKGKQKLVPSESEQYQFQVDKNLYLENGEVVIEVVAENKTGIKTSSSKNVYVGDEAIANASRLERTDYALLIATDEYENWSDLVNPVYDSRTIMETLKEDFGFEVEMMENPTQTEILKKLREYAQKQYKPMDQLFVFFAGHGTYDQAFGEGFVVTTESLVNDEGKTSYLSHNRLRSIINNVPCDHIFLTMDVCFGGTFDEALASARGMDDEVYREKSRSEFISTKLLSKTRKYLTSGVKTYVSDGIPGQHSPFAAKFIEALETKGGSDGVLTITELFSYVEKLKIQPRLGGFGDNAPNSDFLFIAN